MLGIPKHEDAPPTPQHPLSPMGDACSRMDLTAIHQILVTTHYKDDEGTNEVIAHCTVASLQIFFSNVNTKIISLIFIGLVVFPRMDPTNERYVGGKKAWGLGIS